MRSRQLMLALLTLTLMAAGLVLLDRGAPSAAPITQPHLLNVRSHLPAQVAGGPEYAVDGGRLLIGRPGHWTQIPTPPDVIVAAVDVIPLANADGDALGEILYMGAANQLTVYTSHNRGQTWSASALTHPRVHAHVVGGVTAVALDPAQKLLYVGTDTAGLFRVRILPTGLVSTAQLLLPEPVRQIVVDRLGRGLVVARTDRSLYRGEDHGLRWVEVGSLPAGPTALALLPGHAPQVVVGTENGELWQSPDAQTWTALPHDFGADVRVAALAADPLLPKTLYAAFARTGETGRNRQVYSSDGGATWTPLIGAVSGEVTDLLPLSGRRAAVYALTTTSRTPAALGNAAAITARATPPTPASAQTPATHLLAWVAAALGALALVFALVVDLVERKRPFPTAPVDYAPVQVPTDRKRR